MVIKKKMYDVSALLLYVQPSCSVMQKGHNCLAGSHQMLCPVPQNAAGFSDVSFSWVPEINSETGELIAPTFHELTCLT